MKTRTARERAFNGKEIRKRVPRERIAEYSPSESRADPIALLKSLTERRLPYLVPLRNTRMVDSPFTYFRGASVVMAADLSNSVSTGLQLQLCGDAHCLNFGGFASPERNVLFDVNDFDETHVGPWEWDIKRLVTSIVIAGQDAGLRKRDSRAAALLTAREYRLRMTTLATLPALDVWYARLDATHILETAKTAATKRRRTKLADQVATDSIRAAVEKLTVGDGYGQRFRDDPPALFHSSETDRAGFDVEKILSDYRLTLAPEMQVLLDRYALVDHAVKVVGVGSVGTRCAIALFSADDHDPLLLQIKEAVPSVLERYLAPSPYAHQGERVVRGQRLMQVASDAFLGWSTSGKNDFYVRQFKDMKSSADLGNVDVDQLSTYGGYCAHALAAAHARSGDSAGIAGYLGSSATADAAFVAFAEAYAAQNEVDHARFEAAVVEPERPAA